MHSADSDLSPLDSVKRLPRPIRHVFNACVVIGGLAGGGAVLGFSAATWFDRAAHVAEIERLQAAHKVALDVVLPQAEACTRNAASATANATAAVSAAGDVVDKVDAAADKADKAAVKADKAARAAAVRAITAPVPSVAVQPEIVNREIRRANERLKEHGK